MTPWRHLTLVAAVDRNRVLGHGNQLPWHCPADLKRFKELTLGHPIIMGRRTHESIGCALPGRTNIVVTTQLNYEAPNCVVVHSLREAIDHAPDSSEIMVVGGGSVYRSVLDRGWVRRIHLTVVHDTFPGDTYFPDLNPATWRIISLEDHPSDEQNDWPYSFYHLEHHRANGPDAPLLHPLFPPPSFLAKLMPPRTLPTCNNGDSSRGEEFEISG